MVGLGPAGERGQEVVLDRADVEFHQAARRGCGATSPSSLSLARRDFLAGVEVEIVGRGLDPGLGPSGQSGPAGCRRRSGAGRRRCAGAADRCRRRRRANSRSCTGPGRVPCASPIRQSGSPTRPPRATSCSRRLTIIMRAYISSASGYFTLKFRQNPPRTNRLSVGQWGSSCISWATRSYSTSCSAGNAHSVISR